MKKTKVIDNEKKKSAEKQVLSLQRQINYDTKDYTVELVVDKFKKKDFFIPDYQRGFIWAERNKSSFIESVLLGLPIPFMFFADCNDGRLEIIDGAQRVQTLNAFVNCDLTLSNLPKLSELQGFTFNDLSEAQQRRFLNKALRIVVLEASTPNDIRQDIFNRINTTGKKANQSEVRRGSYPGPLTEFIDCCSKNKLFIKLCPVSENKVIRRERFELLLRFFAYVNNYLDADQNVKGFLDNFLVENQHSFNKAAYSKEFERMLKFVNEYFEFGFAKSKDAKSSPRVRFESISVGVALALREKPDLSVPNVDWINSDEFKELTTSDGSNNSGRLKSRIEYVRDHLLKDAIVDG